MANHTEIAKYGTNHKTVEILAGSKVLKAFALLLEVRTIIVDHSSYRPTVSLFGFVVQQPQHDEQCNIRHASTVD
jgi:hypothetical protein